MLDVSAFREHRVASVVSWLLSEGVQCALSVGDFSDWIIYVIALLTPYLEIIGASKSTKRRRPSARNNK